MHLRRYLCGLLLAVFTLPFASAPALAQEDSYSEAGDKEAGLAYDGDDFAEAYFRYYFTDRLAAQAGLGYSRQSFDDGETDDAISEFAFRAAMMYTFCDHPRHRGYVLPFVGYEMFDVTSNLERSGFNTGIALGGDVKLNDFFSLGLEGGIRFASFHDNMPDPQAQGEGGTAGDGTSISIGNTNRLNLTFRFPHSD